VSYSGGVYTVAGSHTYAEEGSYPISIAVADDGVQTATITGTATVGDPNVVAKGGKTITSVEGANTGSVLLATFTDPGGAEVVGKYSADINWGDGTGTQVGAGAITLNGSTFEVRGSHTYAEESAADHPGSTPYQITVTIHHESTTPQVVTSTATVSDPAVVATGGKSVTAVEGATSASQVVATFTDPGGAEATGDYSATINWGDGTASTGADSITVSGGVFSVYGSHKYGEESGADHTGSNPYQITVTIHHESAPDSNQVTSTATVSDAALSASGNSFAGVGCLSTQTVAVATFTDLGGPEPSADYSATINWGGAGSGSTTGTIVANGNGSFSVQGSFTYATDGTFTVTVVITHEHGITATTTSTATIKDNLGILLLDKTGRGALADTGKGNVTVTGCGNIVVDSSDTQAAIASGNGVVSAAEIDVKGTVTHGHGAFLGTIDNNEAPESDPLSYLSAPPVPTTVRSTSTVNITSSMTLQPGLYIGGIKISGQANVILAPGIYYLQGGGFGVSGQATVTDNGLGVLLYNAPATSSDVVSFTSQGDVNLTGLSAAQLAGLGLAAPQYAGLQGLAIFQDRNWAATLSLTGKGNVNITGTIYAAAATIKVAGDGSLNLKGSATKNLGSHLIAADLLVAGNGGVNVDASNNNLQLL
jgi:hypothetical protein